MQWTKGNDLPFDLQREALRRFVHRFTGENRPPWSLSEWKDGKPYPVQFANDADWLANTDFPITKAGKIAKRPNHCHSRPTWPNNPELRPDNKGESHHGIR